MTLGVCFRLRDWLWYGLRPILRRSTRPIPVIPTRSGPGPMVSSVGLEPLEPRLLLSASPTDIQSGQEITTTEPAAIVVLEPGPLPNLDIDLNGRLDALTDGVMVLRHMLGFSGTAVTSGAADPGGRRTDPLDISAYLTSIHSSLDIDLNGQVDALSDGMLVLRYAFGFEGHDLIEPMVLNGQRTDPTAVAQYLDSMNPERETMAPLVVAALQQDTGASNSDGVTFDATVAGTIMDINAIATFRAGFDATTPSGFLDVLSDLRSDGVFVLSQARLAQVAGGVLREGAHTLHLEFGDSRGNITFRDVTFTLDTHAPRVPTFTIHPAYDTGMVGDQQTTLANITLLGMTEIGATVQLGVNGPTQIASPNTRFDVAGRVEFTGQAVALGQNTFTMTAVDMAGNVSSFTNQLTRVASESFDVVVEWNAAHLRAIALAQTPPPYAARNMAIVQASVFDAINGIEQRYEPYLVTGQAPAGASEVAAVAAAAHRALSALYPLQKTTFDTLLASVLAAVPNGQAKTDGIVWGESVADAALLARSNDGSSTFVNYTFGTDPGDWQLTPPGFEPPLLPQWPDVDLFVITSGDQFRPVGPPSLASTVYASDVNEVQAYGSLTNSLRTADQTEIARFWADGARTFTPPGHWNQIAAQFAVQPGRSLLDNAHLFAVLDLALADAGIVAWDAKYTFNFWRPVTAIQQADLDGNAATVKDQNWTPLLTSPNFPEYVSGHSTFSGAGSRILEGMIGPIAGFSTMSLGLPGVYRTFQGFAQAADEAGQSRIYGGIHYQFSNQDGLAAGRSLADYVLAHALPLRSQTTGAGSQSSPLVDISSTDSPTDPMSSSMAFVQMAWVNEFLQNGAGQTTDDDTIAINDI